jgi:hypothetical protein
MKPTLIGLSLATACFASLASAAEIVPVSYTFDQATSCGTYCYHDEGGGQLTDGIYGVEGWGVDLGNGNAQEWVGWVFTPTVNIDFHFATAVNISEVRIGTTQDNISDVVLPSVAVFSSSNGLAWSLVSQLSVPESSSNDRNYLGLGPHTTLTLSGLGITNVSYVRVALSESFNGPWTFTDEVDFIGTAAAVPEPETYAMLLGGLGILGIAFRRQRKGVLAA